MVRKILSKKLLILYICIIVIGFFVGYDYALITSNIDKSDTVSRNLYYTGSENIYKFDEASFESNSEN